MIYRRRWTFEFVTKTEMFRASMYFFFLSPIYSIVLRTLVRESSATTFHHHHHRVVVVVVVVVEICILC